MNFQEECSYKESLKIFCGTFNVNAKHPDEDLHAWLFANSHNNEQHKIDIFAIGFQEVVDLNTQSFLLQSDWAEREANWIRAIDNVLVDYNHLEKIRMFGLLLLVYVNNNNNSNNKKLLDKSIYEVLKAEVATGIMDTVGNKGSIGISLKIHETRLCFICSHFAAEIDKIQKRNSDYRSTRQRLKFEYNANLDYYDLDAHDIIFWMGDLNYRIDSISLTNALDLIYANELDDLLVYDQLLKEKALLNVFEDYNEGKINFRPTYKYLVGHDTYAKRDILKTSSSPNELQCDRIGYTDRILWKQNNKDLNVNLKQYSAINTITLSDHKPVVAIFETEIKCIDLIKFDQKYNEWLKENDRKQNDEMPNITSSHLDYKFNNVLFYDKKTFSFTVTNRGLRLTNVDILFHGQDKWLTINPHSKEKLGPSSSYKIELKTNLNSKILKRLNMNNSIEDIIVISCLNGNHLFFTASIDYKRTIIGYSIQSLSSSSSSTEKSFYESIEQVIQIENELQLFETKLNQIWLDSLKSISNENEILKLKAMVVTNEPIKDFLIHNKIDIYKNCLILLKNEIVKQDKYFENDLASELIHFMQVIIDNNTQENSSAEFDSIEEQKNEILDKLSSKSIEEEFKKYDHECLIQVLNDLLISLPSSIIPDRYFDYIMFAGNNYQDMLFLLDFIPKSNFKLFQMIIKFLKVKNSQQITSIISNALFKIDYDFNKDYNETLTTDMNLHKRKIALNFINIFIQNF